VAGRSRFDALTGELARVYRGPLSDAPIRISHLGLIPATHMRFGPASGESSPSSPASPRTRAGGIEEPRPRCTPIRVPHGPARRAVGLSSHRVACRHAGLAASRWTCSPRFEPFVALLAWAQVPTRSSPQVAPGSGVLRARAAPPSISGRTTTLGAPASRERLRRLARPLAHAESSRRLRGDRLGARTVGIEETPEGCARSRIIASERRTAACQQPESVTICKERHLSCRTAQPYRDHRGVAP
jgi:hypothetical protein